MGADSDHQSTNLMIETTLRPAHKGNGEKIYLVLTFTEKKKQIVGREGDTCYCNRNHCFSCDFSTHESQSNAT